MTAIVHPLTLMYWAKLFFHDASVVNGQFEYSFIVPKTLEFQHKRKMVCTKKDALQNEWFIAILK
jgi:hypothetical protein